MDNKTNNQIHIQDCIIRAQVDKHNYSASLIGECNEMTADETTQSTRLYEQISVLVTEVSQLHQNKHCIGTNLSIKKESENNLTRLVTNEFMFYTKKRFNAEDFGFVFDKILDLAQKQPENLHLILSSFAIKALNKKTMNVVAFITCGKNPGVHFIVKNNVSGIDPVYYKEKNGKRIYFDNIDIKYDKENVFPILNVKGREYHFSYNNILEITTLGGAKKILAIEICLDHGYSLAQKNCTQYIESELTYPLKMFPNQVSQVVTSNTISLEYDKKLEGNITHADPYIPAYDCKPRSDISEEKDISSVFGTKTLNCTIMNSTPCSKLPKNLLTQVENYNERRHVFVYPGPTFAQLVNNTMTHGYQLFSETLNKTSEVIHKVYRDLVDNPSQKRKSSLNENKSSSSKKHKNEH